MKIIKKISMYLLVFIGAAFALFVLYLCICKVNSNYYKPIEKIAMPKKVMEEERRSFNITFERYVGEQNGDTIKVVISDLCLNMNKYYDNDSKLPDLTYKLNENSEEVTIKSSVGELNKEKIAEVRKEIISSDMYNVEVKYNKEDLVDRIIITHK